ncbi:hypothetical protein SEVIR_3G239050v4 [Setaria viridis]|uniref:Uncharacterized protein n=1 Tax=Setaria viridis TaxID=4556 RepID=A0A4U6VI64_SETVI|nr:hypothetical protein SEVIR_3G239050v2 [Setaria viridis]
MKALNARSMGLKYMWRYSHKDDGKEGEMLGKIEGVTRDLFYWRCTIDLQARKCTCRRCTCRRCMSRKLLKFESSTPTRAIISVSTPSTLTRSHRGCWDL